MCGTSGRRTQGRSAGLRRPRQADQESQAMTPAYLQPVMQEIERGPLSYSQGASQYGGESNKEFVERIMRMTAEATARRDANICYAEANNDGWRERATVAATCAQRIEALADELRGAAVIP